MKRNYWIAGIAILLVAAGGFLLVKGIKKNQKLPTGNMTQTQDTPTPAVAATPISGRPQVTIKTAKGDIIIEMRPDVAPKTVANFLDKFTHGYCDNLTFHRVEDWVVQGCDPLGNGTGGNTTLPTETSTESFLRGAVGVARKQEPRDLSNDSQFFVVKKDSQFLDGDYTYFGKVVAGLDVIDKLAIGDKIISTQTLSK